jgi:tetratricopeptide (TPR) repeat protein
MEGEIEEVDDALYSRITELCEEGDEAQAEGEYKAAIVKYDEAWNLLPDPKEKWEASTWILSAIADACFLAGHKEAALETLRYAMTCPGAIGNPFLHMRLGQSLLDTDGDEAQVVDELLRAYMGAGEEIFEDEDPRYLDFLRSRVQL